MPFFLCYPRCRSCCAYGDPNCACANGVATTSKQVLAIVVALIIQHRRMRRSVHSHSRAQLHNDAPVALGRPDMRRLCNLVRSHEDSACGCPFEYRTPTKAVARDQGKVHWSRPQAGSALNECHKRVGRPSAMIASASNDDGRGFSSINASSFTASSCCFLQIQDLKTGFVADACAHIPLIIPLLPLSGSRDQFWRGFTIPSCTI